MPFPTPKVSIAFNDGPYVASPTWTDVSTYVRSATTDRGRSDDWGQFDGSAEVVLDNRTRLFDPYYTSGTYYGKLLPRRQIKIEATYGGTTYPVFRGYISGWPDTWTDAGKDATVTLSCFDALQLLSQVQGPADWSKTYISGTLNPAHYYQCADPISPYLAGQTMPDLGTRNNTITSTASAFPGPELAEGLPSSSIAGSLTGTDSYLYGWGSPLNTNYMANGSVTVMCWFDHGFVIEGGFNDWFFSAECFNTDAHPNQVNVVYGNTSDYYTMGSTDNDMTWVPHHLAFSINTAASNQIKMYLDGNDVTGTRQRTSGLVLRTPEYLWVTGGPITQIVVYSGVLTQAQIQEVVKYSTVNLKETTSARFDRLIGTTSFPSSLTSKPASPTGNVLDITNDAPYIGPELQLVANTESAPLFVTRDGIVTMYKSNTIFTQTKSTTSQQTYGSGGLPMGPGFQIQPDGDSMRNTVNVQLSQGGVWNTYDATSVSTYGTASTNWTTQAASLADGQISGNMIRTLGSTVYPKTAPIDVVLSPDESWASTLGLELNERITVAAAPPTGNTITLPMLVQRIRHTIVPGQWQTSLEGSNRWAQSYTP